MTTLRVVPLRYQEPDKSGWTDVKEECELENAEFIGVFLQNRNGMNFLQDFPTVREAREHAFRLAQDFGASVEDVCTEPLRRAGYNEDQIHYLVRAYESMPRARSALVCFIRSVVSPYSALLEGIGTALNMLGELSIALQQLAGPYDRRKLARLPGRKERIAYLRKEGWKL